ncbi:MULTISPECIES: ATP-binding protein [Streptomyces]|uniref:ATP-binding protein n=1 Tax=Streptomyces yangpuensis TaxID=1648182 RepID=A0ABY5PY11_9ACTN|nr:MULTISPECIES: ATP-binding protein [Streptomyces]MBZ9597015.1 ATP-binding protein [Streptomyces erythrochromogenes]UUY48835.1 ATP-binding protein [Streptomyces yangpuensis]
MNELVIRLNATARAARTLRHAVREHLGPESGDAELCVTELLANVVRHLGEGTPVTLRISGRAARTRVELTDPAPAARPVRREADAADESGRGLALLEALALRWGVTQGHGTKTVWCELDPGHSRRGRVAVITGG